MGKISSMHLNACKKGRSGHWSKLLFNILWRRVYLQAVEQCHCLVSEVRSGSSEHWATVSTAVGTLLLLALLCSVRGTLYCDASLAGAGGIGDRACTHAQ